MLLFTRQIAPNVTFGAWHIAENEQFFRDDLPLAAQEEAELAKHHDALRRTEWMASRWLLHRMTGAAERMPLAKNPFAKPFFTENSDWQCSLSHSQGIVAALLTQSVCGCDIQVLVDKMPRLAPRFMNADELAFVAGHDHATQFLLQHVFWTAKEALYKAYGLREIDFRAHLRIEPFVWADDAVMTTGYVEKEGVQQRYQLYIGLFKGSDDAKAFVWTVAVEG